MVSFDPVASEFLKHAGLEVSKGFVMSSNIPEHPYKRFYVFLGGSDIAQLTMVGYDKEDGVVPAPLKFGSDGVYKAWIVYNYRHNIPDHYSLAGEYNTWLKVYDDHRLSFSLRSPGSKISVYRAGEYGCLINIE